MEIFLGEMEWWSNPLSLFFWLFSGVVDVCFDVFGRAIVATNMGHLGVFHLETTGTQMFPLGKGTIKDAHKGAMNCVETLPKGDQIVSGGTDGLIKLWKCPPVSWLVVVGGGGGGGWWWCCCCCCCSCCRGLRFFPYTTPFTIVSVAHHEIGIDQNI